MIEYYKRKLKEYRQMKRLALKHIDALKLQIHTIDKADDVYDELIAQKEEYRNKLLEIMDKEAKMLEKIESLT